jgi:phosphoesterase RecJ-like protein
MSIPELKVSASAVSIDVKTAADLIRRRNNILIVSHRSPDGDTLGCAFGLHYALKSLGKKSRVACSDGFPERYYFLYENYSPEDFDPEFIIAVDIADTNLFGEKLRELSSHVGLCIDHHSSNSFYAENTLLKSCAAATEIIYSVIKELGVEIGPDIACCIYTGLATDTGCFKFSNTTDQTHTVAAEMIRSGAPYKLINYRMFDMKSRSRIAVEREVYNSMEFFYGEKCALSYIPMDLMEKSGADEYEIEGIAALPRQIEGVEIALTLRESKKDSFRVSIRSSDNYNSALVASAMGGGGHATAAGCTLSGNFEECKARLIAEVGKALKLNG